MGEKKGIKMRAVQSRFIWSNTCPLVNFRTQARRKYKIGKAGEGYIFFKYWYSIDVLTKGQIGEKKGIKMRAVQS